VDDILIERHRVLDLARHGPDVHLDIEALQSTHEFQIEVLHRHGRQGEAFAAPVARVDAQPVINEIENDLECPWPIRNRRRAKSARGDIERHVPPMVHLRRERHSHLARDLGPSMQRLAGLAPRGQREIRPSR